MSDMKKIVLADASEEFRRMLAELVAEEPDLTVAGETASGEELLRYDLGEDFSIETAVVFGELYKHNGEWKFNAIGSGYQGGLAALCANYGVDVE